MLWVIGNAFAAGLADCPRTYDTAEVLEAANAAERSFKDTDSAGFLSSREAMQARVTCSKDILSREAIARVHRVETLLAFFDRRPERIPAALAGVFAAEPGHQIPAALLPEGHPIRALVPNAMTALLDDPGVALPKPARGWIEIDGTHALRAPTQRAAVAQQIDDQGAVVTTHYRWPDEEGFAWVVPVASATKRDRRLADAEPPPDRATPSPWARRAPLLVLSAASLVSSGVLLALAVDGKAQFDAVPPIDADATQEEEEALRSVLEARQAENTNLTVGTLATAGAGLALGAVLVVTW